MINFNEQAAELQRQVIAEQYYDKMWTHVLLKNGMTTTGVREQLYDQGDLQHALHEFWEVLPDSIAIHRPPFGLLCELCEQELR